MKMEETNAHLIEGCRRGKRTAQLALYKQFAQRLYVACLRIVGNASEAEEAMQDSFLKIFTRLAGNIDYKIEGKEILLFKERKEVKR